MEKWTETLTLISVLDMLFLMSQWNTDEEIYEAAGNLDCVSFVEKISHMVGI